MSCRTWVVWFHFTVWWITLHDLSRMFCLIDPQQKNCQSHFCIVLLSWLQLNKGYVCMLKNERSFKTLRFLSAWSKASMLISFHLILINVPDAIFFLSGYPFCSKFCWYEFSSGSWGVWTQTVTDPAVAGQMSLLPADGMRLKSMQDGNLFPRKVSHRGCHRLPLISFRIFFLKIRHWSVLLVPSWTVVFLGERFLLLLYTF